MIFEDLMYLGLLFMQNLCKRVRFLDKTQNSKKKKKKKHHKTWQNFLLICFFASPWTSLIPPLVIQVAPPGNVRKLEMGKLPVKLAFHDTWRVGTKP